MLPAQVWIWVQLVAEKQQLLLLSLGVKLSLINETDVQKLYGNKIYLVGYVRKNDDKE